MIRGFTFERALGWAFTAPNVASFPWVFGAVYAAVFIAAFGIVGLLASGDVGQWFATMESLEGSDNSEAAVAVFWGGFARLVPWAILSSLLSWALWAMFETASQRRYIRGEGFSLGFGMDELRMMVVGLLWGILGFVLIALPMLLIMGGTFWTLFANLSDAPMVNSQEFGNRVLMQMFGVMAVMLVMFPLYVFFATRLAPCFGLTVREGEVRFFDAWNVSRGRAWPILGAYVILAIGGGILGQVIVGTVQAITMPMVMNLGNGVETGEEVRALLLSPSFLVPMGIWAFVALFIQGVMQHMVGGPAAFAVRHDPRGGIEAEAQIGAFT
ncbi:MAG: hypothetical protein RLO80_10990 [Hyphomonas sp.]